MRELTAREYDKTVQALLNTDSSPSQAFVADSRTGPFKDNSARSLVEPLVLQYQRAAEELSAAQDLTQIFPCDVEADLTDAEADACIDEFVRTFGALAYRRPLDDDEAQQLLDLYRSARTDPDAEGTFDAAARTLLEAILQSPYFLNHIRWGDPDAADEQGRIPLSSWELASRLSYFLWDAPPDEGLRLAAQQGTLEDPEVLVEQAMRMAEDQRAVETLKVFFDEWLETDAVLHTEKVSAVFPEFDEDLQQSLHHSLELFLEEVALNPDATLVDLLTANIVMPATARSTPNSSNNSSTSPSTRSLATSLAS